jgi:hypothetical protein
MELLTVDKTIKRWETVGGSWVTGSIPYKDLLGL